MIAFFLGPANTFSESAAAALVPQGDRRPCPSFEAVVESVRLNPGSVGVLPYYNLLEGLVQEGVDLIYEAGMSIRAAARIPVRFDLASPDGGHHHQQVFSHAKALAQCNDYLRNHLPNAEQVAVASTAEAARRVAEAGRGLAIAGRRAIESHGLKLVGEDIGNHRQGRCNYTDFLLISPNSGEPFPADVPCRTMLAVTPHEERVGLLADILRQFAYYGVNVAKIHSRPAIDQVLLAIEPQMFYLELMARPQDAHLQACLAALRWRFEPARAGLDTIRVLGAWSEVG
ncbi:MAG: prephenate dehydratase [Phycisphaerae bacterium]